MKLLVTGGLGFIGSHIAERLVREGHEVSVIDNMHTGSEENVSSIKGRIKVVKGDAGELGKLGGRFDAIFHHGIYSSTPMYKADPHLVPKAIESWTSILEYSRKNDCRIVFASTSSLYSGKKPPHREDMDVPVTDFYTEARYSMERLGQLYSDLYSIKVVALRYFSVYGPHEKSKGRYANLISQFLWDMMAGRQPLIFGDGSQKRDFTYIDDVVEANMLALSHGKTDVFNIGTGKNSTLNDVVALLNAKLGTRIAPRYEANKIKNYVFETLADTSKAASVLGFRANVPLEQGVERLIKYYRK
jgi:UDP-glucose 4-epimerase